MVGGYIVVMAGHQHSGRVRIRVRPGFVSTAPIMRNPDDPGHYIAAHRPAAFWDRAKLD